MRREESGGAPNLWQVVKSVLWSFLGVQSERNRERDFSRGKPVHFIVVGAVMTLLFILLLWGVVRLVLSAAGV